MHSALAVGYPGCTAGGSGYIGAGSGSGSIAPVATATVAVAVGRRQGSGMTLHGRGLSRTSSVFPVNRTFTILGELAPRLSGVLFPGVATGAALQTRTAIPISLRDRIVLDDLPDLDLAARSHNRLEDWYIGMIRIARCLQSFLSRLVIPSGRPTRLGGL